MKKLKNLALVVMIMATALTVQAQEKANSHHIKEYSHHINAGYLKWITSNGFSVGYNASYNLTRYFSLEGQLSYQYVHFYGKSFHGQSAESTSHSGILLIGGRIYFNDREKPTNYYINGLFGGTVINSSTTALGGPGTGPKFYFGALSSGLYIERSNFVAGLGIEFPGGLFLKVGYRFSGSKK